LLLVALALVAAEPRGLEFLMGKMTNDHTASPRTNAVVPESSMLVQAPDLNTAHPLPGTGYDGGKAIKSSTLNPGDPPPQAPDYVMRDDCGTSTGDVKTPFVKFNHKIDTWPGYTNAWCEVGVQEVCANQVANKDVMFQGKSLDVPRGYAYDFWYCKYNGFLKLETREAVAGGWDKLMAWAADFCDSRESKNDGTTYNGEIFNEINMKMMAKYYSRGMQSKDQVPTEEDAKFMGSWLCSMGADGTNRGAVCDVGYCHYTYADLGNGDFGMYEEIDGWDKKKGMPVIENHKLSSTMNDKATSPVKVDLPTELNFEVAGNALVGVTL